MEEWWEQLAYLRTRTTMAVHINWFGVVPALGIPEGELENVHLAALLLDGVLKMKARLEAGRFAVEKLAGRNLDMHQFSRVFGMTRVPCEGADRTHVSLQGVFGTTGFIDPLLSDTQRCSPVTDGYAVGVALLMCLTGLPALDIKARCRKLLCRPDEPAEWEAPGLPDTQAGAWARLAEVYAPAVDYNTRDDGGVFLYKPYVTLPDLGAGLNFTLNALEEMKGDVKVVPSQEADVFSYVASGAELVMLTSTP